MTQIQGPHHQGAKDTKATKKGVQIRQGSGEGTGRRRSKAAHARALADFRVPRKRRVAAAWLQVLFLVVLVSWW